MLLTETVLTESLREPGKGLTSNEFAHESAIMHPNASIRLEDFILNNIINKLRSIL
jgi:hypothetical protein